MFIGIYGLSAFCRLHTRNNHFNDKASLGCGGRSGRLGENVMDKPCPKCGYCPTCGRSNAPHIVPAAPYVSQPWHYPITSGGAALLTNAEAHAVAGVLRGCISDALAALGVEETT
jgi:hypothetical protein